MTKPNQIHETGKLLAAHGARIQAEGARVVGLSDDVRNVAAFADRLLEWAEANNLEEVPHDAPHRTVMITEAGALVIATPLELNGEGADSRVLQAFPSPVEVQAQSARSIWGPPSDKVTSPERCSNLLRAMREWATEVSYAVVTVPLAWFQAAVDQQDRVNRAIDVIVRYGGTEGDHDRVWVIDQALRALTGSNPDEGSSELYRSLVGEWSRADQAHVIEDQDDRRLWHKGVAP